MDFSFRNSLNRKHIHNLNYLIYSKNNFKLTFEIYFLIFAHMKSNYNHHILFYIL